MYISLPHSPKRTSQLINISPIYMLLLPAMRNATGGGVHAYEDHLCTVPSAFTCLIAWLFRHSAYAAMTESQGNWAALERDTHTFISTQEHVGISQMVFQLPPGAHPGTGQWMLTRVTSSRFPSHCSIFLACSLPYLQTTWF